MNIGINSRDLTPSYEAVLNGEGLTWVIYGYDKGGSDLKVVEQGTGGLEELKEEFDESKIQYAFVRVVDPNCELPKLVLIGWCGDGVPEHKKGFFNSHFNQVSNFLKGYHLQINARSETDVEPDYIMKRINESGGSKYMANVNKNAPVKKNDPILPVRSVHQPEKIPNIAELRKQNSRVNEPIQPVRSVHQPVKVPNIAELKKQTPKVNEPVLPFRSVPQPVKEPNITESKKQTPKDDEPILPVRSVYQPEKIPDIAALQKIAPQDDIQPVNSVYQPVHPPKPKKLSINPVFLASEQNKESQTMKVRQEREERERKEREREEREKINREKAEREARERKERERAEREAYEREQQETEREVYEREQQETEQETEREAYEREQQEREQEAYEREQQEREQEAYEREQQAYEQQQIEEEKERERARREQEEEYERQELERQQREAEEETYRLQEAEATQAAEESTTLWARALFGYEAAEGNELSLEDGELIRDIIKVDDGWWQGTTEDGTRSGLFPANFVELIDPEEILNRNNEVVGYNVDLNPDEYEVEQQEVLEAESEEHQALPSARALYDYAAGEHNEISFEEGHIITDIDFVSEDWWQGTEEGGTKGLFPANYVELLQ